ncbi:Extracellular matrix protein fras1 [Mactra antiquata]
MIIFKHTVWQPGPCTVCTCDDPIILCETIRCTDPDCDYDKGEYLQISADSCCPECAAKLSSCTYQQQTIPHNTEWNPEPCVICICNDGEVNCAKKPCPNKSCKTGEIIQQIPGACCPLCIPAGSK